MKENPTMNKTSKLLAELKSAGITQKKVAEMLGVNERHLCYLKKRDDRPLYILALERLLTNEAMKQ